MENDNCDHSEPKSPSESENTSDQEFLASEGSVDSEPTSNRNDPEEADDLQVRVVERQGSSNVPLALGFSSQTELFTSLCPP